MVSEGGGFRQGLILETQGDWLLFYIPDGGPTGGTAGEVRAFPAVEVIVTTYHDYHFRRAYVVEEEALWN